MPIQAYEETVRQGIDETTGEPELDKERVPNDIRRNGQNRKKWHIRIYRSPGGRSWLDG